VSDWVLVVPVRRAGKSRLEVAGVDRAALAHAIALDTLEVAASVAEVIVVTDDEFDLPGIRVVDDPGGGLAGAIEAGLAVAGFGHRGVLLGDLPALRADDLRLALDAAEAIELGVVPDADGTGTTLVTATPGVALVPSFGEGSFTRHVDAGFADLPVPAGSSLRADVDTADQLETAAALGLGPRTAALLGR
jgi:2-phospho-L-lactate/phosphoenolpyruvate guanylyltransferase